MFEPRERRDSIGNCFRSLCFCTNSSWSFDSRFDSYVSIWGSTQRDQHAKASHTARGIHICDMRISIQCIDRRTLAIKTYPARLSLFFFLSYCINDMKLSSFFFFSSRHCYWLSHAQFAVINSHPGSIINLSGRLLVAAQLCADIPRPNKLPRLLAGEWTWSTRALVKGRVQDAPLLLGIRTCPPRFILSGVPSPRSGWFPSISTSGLGTSPEDHSAAIKISTRSCLLAHTRTHTMRSGLSCSVSKAISFGRIMSALLWNRGRR